MCHRVVGIFVQYGSQPRLRRFAVSLAQFGIDEFGKHPHFARRGVGLRQGAFVLPDCRVRPVCGQVVATHAKIAVRLIRCSLLEFLQYRLNRRLIPDCRERIGFNDQGGDVVRLIGEKRIDFCQCRAWILPGQIESRRAQVSLAFAFAGRLERFDDRPQSVPVTAGDQDIGFQQQSRDISG